MRSKVHRVLHFVIDVLKVIHREIEDFIKNVRDHLETIILMVLAVFGLSALIGELPFLYMLPMWIEAAFVTPVLAVIIVACIVRLAEWRAVRRMAKTS